MLVRFCLYSVLKNLRFADPFLVLFLLELQYSFTEIGAALGYQHLLSAVLELPLAVAADRHGRRRALALCFLCYVGAFCAFAAVGPDGTLMLYGALSALGLGQALKSGSHKAIILDYLDSAGRSDEATAVLGLTRAFSKGSAGLSALAGGAVLYTTQAYAPLFHLSALSSLAGFFLVLTYPRSLEGEQSRSDSSPPPLLQALARVIRGRDALRLFMRSVLYESQVKLMLKFYLPPLLQQGLAGFGLAVLGPGALWIGATEAARDSIGAGGAVTSARLQQRLGGSRRTLNFVYWASALLALALVLAAHQSALYLSITLLMAVTFLQNLRRPVFIATFNEVIDKPQRATALSIEHLVRSTLLALLMPVTGLLADSFGLWAAYAAIAAVLLPGLLLGSSSKASS